MSFEKKRFKALLKIFIAYIYIIFWAISKLK
jgi:hypothetical protein